MAGLAVPITRAPRATASWTAVLPIPPEAPLTSSVRPDATPSWSSARVAVSSAIGSAAASTKPRDGGIGAQKVSRASSAAPAPSSEMPNTRSPTATSVTPVAELVDDTRDVAARRLREPGPKLSRRCASSPSRRVDAGRAHDDPDLAGTRVRVGEIHDLEDLGATEPAELGCFHHWLRGRLWLPRLPPRVSRRIQPRSRAGWVRTPPSTSTARLPRSRAPECQRVRVPGIGALR